MANDDFKAELEKIAQSIEELEGSIEERRKSKEEFFKRHNVPLPEDGVALVTAIPIKWIEEYIKRHPKKEKEIKRMVDEWLHEK
jgi:hypothetical protein